MLRRRFRRQSGRNAQKSERNIFLDGLLSANDTHTDSASPGRERPFSHSVEVSTRTDKPRGAQARHGAHETFQTGLIRQNGTFHIDTQIRHVEVLRYELHELKEEGAVLPVPYPADPANSCTCAGIYPACANEAIKSKSSRP